MRTAYNMTSKRAAATAILLAAGILGFKSSQAQVSQSASSTRSIHDYEALPPSPTVAALGNYGNIPVSYHTGIPDISVPLHALSVKGLEIPITLTYHSTGLLVGERASNVGLGWSCSALSVIGHTIMGGVGDFDNHGYCQGADWHDVPDNFRVSYNNTQGSLYDFSEDILKKLNDVEPDVYSYSFPGQSGKFVFDRQGVPHTIPYTPLKINHRFVSTYVEGFDITDESGNVFIFGYRPGSTVAGLGESSVTTDLTPGCGATNITKTSSGTTGYFLSKIITPYRDTVDFYYSSVTEIYHNPSDLTEYQPTGLIGDMDGSCSNIYPNHTCVTQTKHETQLLTEIRHRGESIAFDYDTARLDFEPGGRGAMLAAVTVRYAGQIRKEFQLYHSYFGDPTTSSATVSNPDLTAADNGRLRLDSIRQVGVPAYRFDYNTPSGISFPAVRSYAQDRWGYYNGKTDNRTLVERPNNLTPTDRESDSIAVKVGMLRRITYPTGGTSTFTYEANQIFQPGRFLDGLIDIGGFFLESPELAAPVRTSYTFTTGGPANGSVPVSLLIRFSANTTAYTEGFASTVIIDDATGQEVSNVIGSGVFLDNTAAPYQVTLAANHTYTVRGNASGGQKAGPDDPDRPFYIDVRVRTQPYLPEGNQAVGGCRIKQIVTNGQTLYGPPSTTFYNYNHAQGVSSGYTLTQPVLTSEARYGHFETRHQASGQPFTVEVLCIYNSFVQNSANQVGQIGGGPVAYTHVTKFITSPLNGATQKSVYEYNQVEDDQGLSNTEVV